MRHRLALLAVLGAATICGGGPAVAQLAVTDTAREATETSIADCMTKVNASKHQEVAPAQGVTGSMVSPGQGATVSSAGQTVVSGVGTPVSTGTVSGMNLSAAIPSLSGMVATTSTGQLNLNAVAQVLASLTGREHGAVVEPNRPERDKRDYRVPVPSAGGMEPKQRRAGQQCEHLESIYSARDFDRAIVEPKESERDRLGERGVWLSQLQPGGGDFDEWRADAEHKRNRHPDCQCVLRLGGATTGCAASGGGATVSGGALISFPGIFARRK